MLFFVPTFVTFPSILIRDLYQLFELGGRVQLSAPTGLETGIVDEMTMGHIIVLTDNGGQIVVPNSVAVSQVVIKLTV